jgi:hypothetical protein
MTALQSVLLQVVLFAVLWIVFDTSFDCIEYMLTRTQRRHLREQSEKKLADDCRYVVENGPYR